jgi:hypothetical protein
MICAGLVMLVIITRWDLRKHVWFWVVIILAAFVQVPLVLFIPWKNRNLTGISLLPVAVLDYVIVYGCVKLAEKVAKRASCCAEPTELSFLLSR